MSTSYPHCRDIFSLSNQEIIKLVDFIFDDVNLDRLVYYLHQERPSLSRKITYRKIEVCSSYYDWAYIIKVTYKFKGLDRAVTTGLVLSMEGAPGDEQFHMRDIAIHTVKGFYRSMEGVIWDKGIADDFNIEVNFDVFRLYVNKLQNFLKDELQLWKIQPHSNKHVWNVQLHDMVKDNPITTFVVDEINISENEINVNTVQ